MKQKSGNLRKVFSFTFRQRTGSKSWRAVTWVVLFLCIALPTGLMILAESLSGTGGYVYDGAVETVYVVSGDRGDYSALNGAGDEAFSQIEYTVCETEEAAAKAASQNPRSLLLLQTQQQGTAVFQVLLPEGTELTEGDRDAFARFFSSAYPLLLLENSGVSPEQLAVLAQPSQGEIVTPQGTQDPVETVRMIFSIVMPYGIIMVLYFMILAYGQNVAASVLMEKSSKLMDTFLLAVKPSSLIFGKVLAGAAAGILQLGLWVCGLVAGFAAGGAAVRAMNPQTDLAILKFFDLFGSVSGLFSLPGIILSVVIVLTGFVLYCTLAAMGGAMAGKAEDLSNTNILFSMALVISFFAVLWGGGLEGAMNGGAWQLYMPFSAMLAAPGMILMGEMSLWQGLISEVILVVTTILVGKLAGAVYKAMVFYRGNPPTPRKVLELLRGRKSS